MKEEIKKGKEKKAKKTVSKKKIIISCGGMPSRESYYALPFSPCHTLLFINFFLLPFTPFFPFFGPLSCFCTEHAGAGVSD